jgi:hypothetical protein
MGVCRAGDRLLPEMWCEFAARQMFQSERRSV